MKITEITSLKKSIAEDAGAGASASGAFATSMGGGNGFANGGPGTITRAGSTKRKTKKRTK